MELIVGVRGSFERRAAHIPPCVDFALSHTLDRWGIPGVWGACDSGADLETRGENVLRGWTHVRLRAGADSAAEQLAISGLLRTTWDALELYGALELSGVDAIVPVRFAGDEVWTRVAGSVVRDAERAAANRPRVRVEAGRAWPTSQAIRWDADAINEMLAEFVDVQALTGGIEPAAYPTSTIEHPFGPADDDPFRAEVALLAWTIDDAGWLTEVLANAFHRSGVRADVQIAVRLVRRSA